MAIVCTILGAGCILYYICLAVYAGPAFHFGWFWIALGAAFFLAAFLRRLSGSGPSLWAARILLCLIAAGLAVIGIFSALVIGGMRTTAPKGLSTVIVLGAQVRGTRPSRALLKRLEAARKVVGEYADGIPDGISDGIPDGISDGSSEDIPAKEEVAGRGEEKSTESMATLKMILSGGQGGGEDISEAQCMWEYLTGNGVDEKVLYLEDRSTSTRENLVFSDRLYGCGKEPCGIISNDFHLYRALQIARKAGYGEVYGIAADGDPLMEVHYVVREAVAVLYEKIRG